MIKADTVGQLEEIREEVEDGDGDAKKTQNSGDGQWTIEMA
jgi:hypothetical protein